MRHLDHLAPTVPTRMETIRILLGKAEDILDQYDGLDEVYELIEAVIDETWKE